MSKDRLTKSANVVVAAREIDFVSRFQKNWDDLRNIMGVSRPILKAPGTALKVKTATVTLQSSVGEGEEIPYSQAAVSESTIGSITLEKYAKAVSAEAIEDHGYDNAVALTDDAFLNELQGVVMDRFYDFLLTGTLTTTEANFQKALAIARGMVLNKFKAMHRTVTEVVGFVNIMDFYGYLGAAELNVQTQFGMTYISNFLGYKTIFLCADGEIPRGKVIAVPRENIVMYYIDPSSSDLQRAGLQYTTVGITPLIGFHTEGKYTHAVSECFAIMGITLFAEYLDGIAVVTNSGVSL